MKIDPYKHKEKYFAWKEKTGERIFEISKTNSDLALRYIFDMEKGLNVSASSKKGARSYIRLNNIKQRIIFLIKKFEERFETFDLSKVKEEELHTFFNEMSNGTFKRQDGGEYQSVADYVKVFKAFWHWYQKTSRKIGIKIEDITQDLDTSQSKPKWVYLTEEEVKILCDNAKPNYKVLIMFLFDTGIRAPTELMNIRVSDFYNDFKEVNIRDEISKTFGRRIKLMLCSNLIKKYIEFEQLSSDQYVFQITPSSVNQYLKRLSKRILGEGKSPAGETYDKLTMYDFRHCSCCYWLPRYKSESALKFRFGWKKSDKIHYYSELLGMRDTISEEDLLIDTTKTEIEKQLIKSENEKEIMQERMQSMEEQMRIILEYVKREEFLIGEKY
jgi:integrase